MWCGLCGVRPSAISCMVLLFCLNWFVEHLRSFCTQLFLSYWQSNSSSSWSKLWVSSKFHRKRFLGFSNYARVLYQYLIKIPLVLHPVMLAKMLVFFFLFYFSIFCEKTEIYFCFSFALSEVSLLEHLKDWAAFLWHLCAWTQKKILDSRKKIFKTERSDAAVSFDCFLYMYRIHFPLVPF